MERWVAGLFILILLLFGGLAVVLSEQSSTSAKNFETSATCPNGQFAQNESVIGAFQCTSAVTLATPCSTFFIQSAATFTSYSCDSKNIFTSGTDAYTVIQKTINNCFLGCQITLSNGTFTLTKTLVLNRSNVLFSGVGFSTIFKVTSSFSTNVFNVTGQNNILTRFALNASGQTLGQSYAGISSRGANNTYSFLRIINPDHGGINIQAANFNVVTNDYVQNASDDAYIIGFSKFGVISHNIADKTNIRNCYSLVQTSDTIVSENICVASGQVGVGIEPGTSGPCQNDLISNNIINKTSSIGIDVYPVSGGINGGENITIDHNIIAFAQLNAGILINSGNKMTVSYNQILNPNVQCLQAGSGGVTYSAYKINDNYCLKPNGKGFFISTITGFTLNGNTVDQQGTNNYDFFTATGIYGTETGNIGLNSVSNANCFDVDAASSYINVVANTCRSSVSGSNFAFAIGEKHGTLSSNIATTFTNGIIELTGADFNNFIGNDLSGIITTKITIIGNNTRVFDNAGYNPFGVRGNFILPQGGGSGGNWISPKGTTATIAASTAYTISNIPVLILVQAIGLSTISINAGAAITPTIGESFYLYPGQTINFGAFGGSPPTLQVIFS